MKNARLYFGSLQNQIFHALSQQTFLRAIPSHGHEMLVSFVFFSAISWAMYLVIAPRLLQFSKKKDPAVTGYARAKWGHMTVSFVHAIISCVWCLCLWNDRSISRTAAERVLGYSPRFGRLFAVSVGYFLWDVCCCLWFVQQYGLGFLLHAFLGFGGLLACYGPFMMYPTSRFLLFEVSTIFVDMHWFLEKLGYGKSVIILLNDALGLLAYLGIRLIFGTYLTYSFMADLLAMWDRVPLVYAIAAVFAHCTTHLLNFYWFYKLLRSLFKRTKLPPPVDTKKQN